MHFWWIKKTVSWRHKKLWGGDWKLDGTHRNIKTLFLPGTADIPVSSGSPHWVSSFWRTEASWVLPVLLSLCLLGFPPAPPPQQEPLHRIDGKVGKHWRQSLHIENSKIVMNQYNMNSYYKFHNTLYDYFFGHLREHFGNTISLP